MTQWWEQACWPFSKMKVFVGKVVRVVVVKLPLLCMNLKTKGRARQARAVTVVSV